ncbi:glucan-beta-glucosidase [Colletotrichum asianum]|uniref:Glucan-beta-glucosidase n=1 Tax=Colletotrichum asianum TaxID=702518 RepID=A0A8H3W4T0_9PEZI|nr:glucan-beta-glucosidase [Colletotrichum asianum]
MQTRAGGHQPDNFASLGTTVTIRSPSHASSVSRPILVRQTAVTPPTYFPGSATPLLEQARRCHNEADFPGHADIRSRKQEDGVAAFCRSEKGRTILRRSVHGAQPYPAIRFRHSDRWRIKHDFKVEWQPGCDTGEISQDIQRPLGDESPTCYNLMRANYLNCNNGGVGGSVQVGCLIYTYNGGKDGAYY